MKLSVPFLALVSWVSLVSASQFEQHLLGNLNNYDASAEYTALEAELEALLALYDDPVAAMKAYDPSSAAELDEPRLLEVMGSGEQPVWMTEGDKLRLRRAGKKFIDVTEPLPVAEVKQTTWPTELRQKDQVALVTSRLSLDNLNSTITTLTSFWNRHYKQEHGRESSHWVFNQVLDIIQNAPSKPALSVERFTHSFPQSSVIARFEPSTGRNASAPVFIIGAHQDSANYRARRAQTTTARARILEAFRQLVALGFQPQHPVEFHWYAAEEGGGLGARDIVRDYVAKGVNVGAMIQFDMTAFVRRGTTPTFTMISTDVDNALTNYTVKLAEAYIDEPVQQARLFPGAGSDHMSWYRAGFPAVFATEGDPMAGHFDPYIHTKGDRHDIPEFSLEHALEASKVAVAFVVELGGWTD